jgi:hypothetical protein
MSNNVFSLFCRRLTSYVPDGLRVLPDFSKLKSLVLMNRKSFGGSGVCGDIHYRFNSAGVSARSSTFH